MSRRPLRVLGVLLIACLVGSVVAAPAAPAKRLTAKQKRVIKKKLMRQVKKHPRVVLRKSWLRKADMVDFNLPTTIRLNPAASNTPVFSGDFSGVGRYRPDFNTTNANTVASDDTALLNLGQSLGSR